MGLGLLRREPYRAAPHAGGTECHGCGHLAAPADAAGPQHRNRRHRIHDLGYQDHGAYLARVPTGLGALGDDDVGSGVDVALRVGPCPGQRSHLHPDLVATVDHLGGRRAEGVGHQGGAVRQGDLEVLVRPVGRERHVVGTDGPTTVGIGIVRHVVAVQEVVQERPVPGGDQVGHVRQLQPARLVACVPGRHDQVDSVRSVTDLVLDPGQVHLESLGRVGYGAEHAEATGPGNRGDDVATV